MGLALPVWTSSVPREEQPHTHPHGSQASQEAVGGTTRDPPRNTWLHGPGARHLSHTCALTKYTSAVWHGFRSGYSKAHHADVGQTCIFPTVWGQSQAAAWREVMFEADGSRSKLPGRWRGTGRWVHVWAGKGGLGSKTGFWALAHPPLCPLPALHQLMQPMGRKMLWSQTHLRSRNPASFCPGWRRRGAGAARPTECHRRSGPRTCMPHAARSSDHEGETTVCTTQHLKTPRCCL